MDLDVIDEDYPHFAPDLGDAELMEQILQAKKGDPSQFASYWEMDENDVDEATDEEIQNDPVLRTLWAAERGEMDILKEMIRTNADLIMARDRDGYTPLHRASYEGHMDIVKFLLEKGADIEGRTSDGWTPLHSASYWGQSLVAGFLLAHGANINAQTNGKQSALHLAANGTESVDVLKLLLMNPLTDFTLINRQGDSAKAVAERNCKHYHLFEIADPAINSLKKQDSNLALTE